MASINISGTDWFFQHQPGTRYPGTLVFIHGSGGSHHLWDAQMDLGFDCIALDLPGHGQSGGKPAASISDYAAAVSEFLAQMQLSRPVYLAGHSMGAAISLTCALRQPDLLDGIILIGAGPRMKVMPSFLDALRSGNSDPGFFKLAFSPDAPAQMVDDMVQTISLVPAEVLYADFSACNDFDISQELEGIRLPALLIVGVDDKLTPQKLAQYISDHLTRARLEVIPGAGHFVMIEKPIEVNRLITDFCTQPR